MTDDLTGTDAIIDLPEDAPAGDLAAELRSLELVVAILVQHSSSCAQKQIIRALDALDKEEHT